MSEKTTVKWTKMSGVEELEDPTTFPSRWIPVVPFHGTELWVEGKRYLTGMIRPMMDAQRAVNFAASSDIEMVTQQPKAPYLAAWESIEDHEADWKAMNSSNASYLPYNAFDENGNPLPAPSRQAPPQGGSAYGRMTEMAIGFVKSSIGNYNSNLGAPSNAVSGIAKRTDEQQGNTANFHYQDNGARSIEHIGRILIDAFPTIYADTDYGPRDLRSLGLDGTSEVVTVDPTMATAFQKKGKKIVSINPTSGKYDVRIKVGPAFASLREEAADSLTKIVQSSPQLMTILGPMWARMQDWPEAEKVSKLLLAMAPPQVQEIENGDEEIPPQAQAKIQQLTQHAQQLEQALQNAAQQHQELEQQVQSKAQVEQFKAQALAQREADKHQREIEYESMKTQSAQQIQAAKDEASRAIEIDKLKHDAQVKDLQNSVLIELANINNKAQYDRTELQSLALIVAKGMAPPPSLSADTDADIAKQT